MFMKRVARRYSNQTLERLVSVGDHVTRRAAVLSLSLMSDYSSNAVLGRALVDRDRGVRTIAESGIRELWCRIGSRHQQEMLREVSDRANSRLTMEHRSLVPTRHGSLSLGPIRCSHSRLPPSARNQPVSLHRGGGHGTMLHAARQPRRRVGSFPTRTPVESRPGRSPRPSSAPSALAQEGLAFSRDAEALRSGARCSTRHYFTNRPRGIPIAWRTPDEYRCGFAVNCCSVASLANM